MSPVAVSPDKRFHRAHVKPSRRRGPWRGVAAAALKYLLFAAVAASAVYKGSAIVTDAALLQIDRIVVRGNEHLTHRDVLAVLSGLPGENLVRTDLEAWRGRLLLSPWVREAFLRRSFPSTVEVAIVERRPIGIGRIGGELYLVDERGSIIDRYGPLYAALDLPIIDGLSPSPGAAGGDDARGRLAAKLISALRVRPEVAARVSQVDVRDLHNAAVILNGDPAVIYVGEDRFLPRIESYLELATTLRERVSDIDYVDLRFDQRIYVRPVQAGRRQ
jgi:cell division protein FtsQ